MFLRLFIGCDLEVWLIYRRIRNANVIMNSEFLKDVGESIVADTRYGTPMEVQRKTTGNLTQSSTLYDRDFNWNQMNVNQKRFL
jgi:hypothetical protein